LKRQSIKLISLLKLLTVSVIIFSACSESAPLQTNIPMITMDQSPYGYKDKEGKNTGILYEIMNAIMQASDIGEKNRLIPSKRLLITMLSGNPVCTLIANTPGIDTELDFIAPIGYALKAGILPRMDSGITDYKSLQGKTVAVPLGVQFDEVFHNDTSIIKVSPPKYINAMHMLKAGRVDAVAGAIANLKVMAKNIGMANKDLASPIVLLKGEVQLVCSKEVSMTTRQKLKKTVNQLKASGEIQSILHRYFQSE